MRRYLVVALPILLLGAALYVIGSAGSPRHTKSTPQLAAPGAASGHDADPADHRPRHGRSDDGADRPRSRRRRSRRRPR